MDTGAATPLPSGGFAVVEGVRKRLFTWTFGDLSIEEADYYPWQYGLFRNDPYRVVDGQVTVPSEPGWGVEIEPEWLARSTYQVSEAG